MLRYPTIAECEQIGYNKGDVLCELLNNKTGGIDYALPQPWLDALTERLPYDFYGVDDIDPDCEPSEYMRRCGDRVYQTLRFSFCWDCSLNRPMPITVEGIAALAFIAGGI